MGLLIEVFGVIFISLEAIGLKRFQRIFSLIYDASSWSKKSLKRLFLITAPLLTLIMIGVLADIKILTALAIPILILSQGISVLIDHPEWVEKWVLIKTKEGKIGPIGLIIILIGNLLQLISLIWQMSMDKNIL